MVIHTSTCIKTRETLLRFSALRVSVAPLLAKLINFQQQPLVAFTLKEHVATGEEMIDKQMPNLGFKAMAFSFKIRDFFRPRKDIVKEVGIREGFRVLDYGCGPGSYVKAVAELVGKSGKIYALDINPLAVQMVKKIAAENRLTNVETILSDCKTGLSDGSIDVVLLYDTFHALTNADAVLEELRRVLKPEGVLSFSDHHMKEDEIVSKVTDKGLFRLLRKGEKTCSFVKKEA